VVRREDGVVDRVKLHLYCNCMRLGPKRPCAVILEDPRASLADWYPEEFEPLSEQELDSLLRWHPPRGRFAPR